MPGFPGIPGLVAFTGVKFAGYALAGMALKKLEPTIVASAVRIAAIRTGLGLLLGAPVSFVGVLLISNFAIFTAHGGEMPTYVLYFPLACLRVLIWLLVIRVFAGHAEIESGRHWWLALLGALWSCFLDLPGYWLLVNSPGQIPVC